MPAAVSIRRSHARTLLGVTTAALVSAALASGCGANVVDDQKLEDQITANLENRTGVRITSAVCPTGIDVEPGRRFDCVVAAHGGRRARVTVLIRNRDADVTIVALSAKR